MKRPARRWRLAVLPALCLASASGCVPGRTVLVAEDSPLRAGPGMTGRVYSLQPDRTWKVSDAPVAIPEGWYLVPPRFVHPEDFGP